MSGTSLQAGAAEAVIPSQPGMDLAGFVARENPSRGNHDDIFARALALESDGTLLILVVADVLGFEASTVRRIRDATARSLGSIAGSSARQLSIAVCATHTHSAPASMPLRNCGELEAAFVDDAVRALTGAAAAAVHRLQPARLGTGSGSVHTVSGNRRSGGTRSNGVPRVQEPYDTEVGVLRVDAAADGKPLACLVNFACHPVILGQGNLDISADYPGVVTAGLKERLGGAITLFTNGATADINPMRRDTWADVEWVAGPIVAEAERVWWAVQTSAEVPLSARSEEVSLPFLPLPSSQQLEEMARRFLAQQDDEAARPAERRVANAFRRWAEDALQNYEEEARLRCSVEIQVLRVGDAALIAVPGEFFVELGLQIKERMVAAGVRPAWLLGYTNGNIGYIPARAAYAQGGYEVETAHRFYRQPACLAPEAGEAIVERAIALATQRHTVRDSTRRIRKQ